MIWAKLEQEQGSFRKKNRIDVNRFWLDVKQVLTSSDEIRKFHCTSSYIIHNFTLLRRFHVQISYKYIKNFSDRTIIQYLSTADIDTFICPIVPCAILLAIGTPVRKTFTTTVAQMQRRRHHMTTRGSSLYACSLLLCRNVINRYTWTRCDHTLYIRDVREWLTFVYPFPPIPVYDFVTISIPTFGKS